MSLLGASGTVRIDESGDRDPDYSLKYYVNGSFQNIADYNHTTGGFNLRGETERASVILLSHALKIASSSGRTFFTQFCIAMQL